MAGPDSPLGTVKNESGGEALEANIPAHPPYPRGGWAPTEPTPGPSECQATVACELWKQCLAFDKGFVYARYARARPLGLGM